MSGPQRSGYLGLGSNLGDRAQHLRSAIAALEEGEVRVEGVSSLYETAPVGEYQGPQPDFLNLVVAITTALAPEELLDLCKRIERGSGREPHGPRHGPRPLDADILLLGDLLLSEPRLSIPHPAMTSRRFVLEPLLELDPDAELPDGTLLRESLGRLPAERVERRGPLDLSQA